LAQLGVQVIADDPGEPSVEVYQAHRPEEREFYARDIIHGSAEG
jgi:hypothetical protein